MRVNQQLETSISRATFLAKAFIAWNVVFLAISVAAAAAGSIADDAVVAVLVRATFFAAAGMIPIYLLRQMRLGRRSGWFRLGLISVLAPIGIVVFIVFQPDLPVWFVVGQLGSGLMLLGIASIVLRKDVRREFPKVAEEPAARDSAV